MNRVMLGHPLVKAPGLGPLVSPHGHLKISGHLIWRQKNPKVCFERQKQKLSHFTSKATQHHFFHSESAEANLETGREIEHSPARREVDEFSDAFKQFHRWDLRNLSVGCLLPVYCIVINLEDVIQSLLSPNVSFPSARPGHPPLFRPQISQMGLRFKFFTSPLLENIRNTNEVF